MAESSQFQAIRQLYPEHGIAFDLLLLSNEDFRAACQDYEECLRALADPRMGRYTMNWHLISRKIRNEILEYLLGFSAAATEDHKETPSTIS